MCKWVKNKKMKMTQSHTYRDVILWWQNSDRHFILHMFGRGWGESLVVIYHILMALLGCFCMSVDSYFVHWSTIPMFCFIRYNHHSPGHNFPCTGYHTGLHKWFGLDNRKSSAKRTPFNVDRCLGRLNSCFFLIAPQFSIMWEFASRSY